MRAEQWRWSSLWHRCQDTGLAWLSDWPLRVPDHWVEYVNDVETEAELSALRRALMRGAPYGEQAWQRETAKALHLQSALRQVGRPKKFKQPPEEI